MKAVVFAKRSERFPGKHMSLLGGSTLIDCIVSEILESDIISEVAVFTKDPVVRTSLCEVVSDTTEGSIADSLLSALRIFGGIFAVAGDMPCISHGLLDEMAGISGGSTLVPIHSDGLIDPMLAIYSSEHASVLESNIIGQRKSLRDFIYRIPHMMYEIPEKWEKCFYNVNYESDLELLRKDGCTGSKPT